MKILLACVVGTVLVAQQISAINQALFGAGGGKREGRPIEPHSSFSQTEFPNDSTDSWLSITTDLKANQQFERHRQTLDQNTGLNSVLPLWTGRFDNAGVGYDYRMVGTDPVQGSATTIIPTEIVSFRFVFSNGIVLDPSTDQFGGANVLQSVLGSPIFQPVNFSIGGTSLGNTQFGDAFQRGNFWSLVSTKAPDYHILLGQPQVINQTLIVPAEKGSTGPPPGSPPGSNLVIGMVDIDWLDQQSHQLLTSLNIDPGSLTIFLSHNTLLTTRGSLAAVGYHDFVPVSAQGGGQTYLEVPYIDENIFPGSGDSDVNTLSHELAEWIDDPFLNNFVPTWKYPNAGSTCFEDFLLEVGDPVETPDFPPIVVSVNGMTYHLQDEVFVSWFARSFPSTAANGFYTMANALNAFSQSCPNSFTNVHFDSVSYTVSEGAGFATIGVTRVSNTTGKFTVDFETSDGSAQQRSDYTLTGGTLTFVPGETRKSFTIPIVDDTFVEASETLNVTLSNPTGGAVLDSPSTATLTIIDNDSTVPTTNPLDDARFFAKLHYFDFLSRYPDQAGWDYWTSQITQCGTDPICIRNKRNDVSNAFFYELEFQQTGAYAYRLYRSAYGNTQPFPNPDNSNPAEANKLPSYGAFASDRARVIGGADLTTGQQNLAKAFMQRTEFTNRYPASLSTAAQFVDAVLATIRSDIKDANGVGVDLSSQRTALMNLFDSSGGGNAGRAAVMYRLANDDGAGPNNGINNRPFIDSEYNRSFVYTQYAGYLRRDADIAGFLFWLGQVNRFPIRDGNAQHAMVCSFITSVEYQQRFSPVVSHNNTECPQ